MLERGVGVVGSSAGIDLLDISHGTQGGRSLLLQVACRSKGVAASLRIADNVSPHVVSHLYAERVQDLYSGRNHIGTLTTYQLLAEVGLLTCRCDAETLVVGGEDGKTIGCATAKINHIQHILIKCRGMRVQHEVLYLHILAVDFTDAQRARQFQGVAKGIHRGIFYGKHLAGVVIPKQTIAAAFLFEGISHIILKTILYLSHHVGKHILLIAVVAFRVFAIYFAVEHPVDHLLVAQLTTVKDFNFWSILSVFGRLIVFVLVFTTCRRSQCQEAHDSNAHNVFTIHDMILFFL